MFEITKEYHFSAAHSLTSLPKAHKCHHLHGHNYVVTVGCTAEKLDKHGMVMDFARIDKAVENLTKFLDHTNLNDLFSFQTTSEELARWLFDSIEVQGFEGLYFVSISETPATRATYFKK